jgi:glycosyltransferase involved in cell wall biosynthesis
MTMASRDSVQNVSFILAVMGRYSRIAQALQNSLTCMEPLIRDSDCDLVIAFESDSWLGTPLAQTLRLRFPKERLTVLARECGNLPAKLYNEAARFGTNRYLHFLWPGCRPIAERVGATSARMDESHLDWSAHIDPFILSRLGVDADFIARFGSYFMSCKRLFSSAQALLRSEVFTELGGFDASPVLQRHFDVEFWLRVLKGQAKIRLDSGYIAEEDWAWPVFPLSHDLRIPRFVAQSFALRASRAASQKGHDEKMLSGFIQDLPVKEAQLVGERCFAAHGLASEHSNRRRYKIAVTGNIWDYVHNRLCFYNHFEYLEGKQLFTYVPLQDSLIDPEIDLCGIDAVIISRGRIDNTLRILDYCQLQRIPAIYMIDDNWLTIGQDWPEIYSSSFSPGKSAYSVFIECLKRCDSVLVYNDILAEDVEPYVKDLIKLPVNVRMDDFRGGIRDEECLKLVADLNKWREKTQGLILGYAGSVRYSDAPFRALASAVEEHTKDTKVIFFGFVTDAQRNAFRHKPITLPYMSYEDYAAVMGALRPDILIAPLDPSRTSMSKCPNKYLEYSAAGSAGIYSSVYPYTDVIEDGQNGLLVSSSDEAGWKAAIQRLLLDDDLRRCLSANAARAVALQYDTAVVAPLFAEALLGLLERGASRG